MLVEYPSYGVYNYAQPTEDRMFEDALTVYDWAVKEMRFKPDNIFLFGRSIGSGPATFLASQRQSRMLILFSPYTSIREVATDHVSFLGYLVKNRFNNLENIKKANMPVFLLHGLKVSL